MEYIHSTKITATSFELAEFIFESKIPAISILFPWLEDFHFIVKYLVVDEKDVFVYT